MAKYEGLNKPNWFWDEGWSKKRVCQHLKKCWKARRKQENIRARRRAFNKRLDKLS